MRAAAVIALVLAATPAFADAPIDLDASARGDAAAARGFAFDSGLVLGGGEVDVATRFAWHRGIDLAAGVGLGGGLELSVDGLLAGDQANHGAFEAAGAQLRVRVARGARYTVSIAGSYHAGRLFTVHQYPTCPAGVGPCGEAGSPRDDIFAVGADAAVALTRRLELSAGLGVARVLGDRPYVYGHVDATLALWSHLKLLAEVGELRGTLGVFGARIATRHFSADVGIGLTDSSSDLGAAVPGPFAVIALAARL